MPHCKPLWKRLARFHAEGRRRHFAVQRVLSLAANIVCRHAAEVVSPRILTSTVNAQELADPQQSCRPKEILTAITEATENKRERGNVMTDLENRLAEALRRAMPLLSRAHIGHYNERRVALQDAREALAEYDRAVIAETKAAPQKS